jgi:Outer membrane protein beta-barrel domain
MKKATLLSGFILLIAGVLSAQETSHLAFSVGGGFTTPVGNTGANLNEGWNVRGGAGFNFNSYAGVLVDLGFDSMGINSTVLSNLGYGGGRFSIFSATLDPIFHVNPKGHVDVYVTGGGGFYHQYQDFTQPGTATGIGFNPFFGFYQATVPVNVVVASYSVNKPGIDAGMGFAFGSKWHGKFFAEAKYNRIFTGNYHTDYVPVTFGFRW